MTRAWASGLALLGLVCAFPGSARAQTIQSEGLELDFTGRVQVQFSTTSVGEGDLAPGSAPAGTAFEVRRLYFGTGFAYDEWLTGLVQFNFGGGGARLQDGYIDAALDDRMSIRMGQFKKPFGLFELTSNTRILTIERAVRLRGLEDLVGVPGEAQYLLSESGYPGRQVGVMVHGTGGGVGYAAGVFNGEGANQPDELGSKAFAGRATFEPGAGPLVVGGAVSVQPTGEFDADGDEIRATAFAVDAEWGGFRAEGLHVMAELMFGDNPLLLTPDIEPSSMVGAQAVVAWFSPRSGRIEGVEPVLRLSWADPDTETADDEAVLLTPGANLYFAGRNRLMVNADVYVPSAGGLDPELGLRAQFQIYF